MQGRALQLPNMSIIDPSASSSTSSASSAPFCRLFLNTTHLRFHCYLMPHEFLTDPINQASPIFPGLSYFQTNPPYLPARTSRNHQGRQISRPHCLRHSFCSHHTFTIASELSPPTAPQSWLKRKN